MVLQKLSDVLEEPITKDDNDKCHRVRTKNSSCPHVIVQFRSRAKRDAVLQKARKTKMTARNLGYNQNNAICVNENWCPYLKRLMGKTIAQKRDKAWRFFWTKDGQILARKDENTQVVRIASDRDLEKIY